MKIYSGTFGVLGACVYILFCGGPNVFSGGFFRCLGQRSCRLNKPPKNSCLVLQELVLNSIAASPMRLTGSPFFYPGETSDVKLTSV